MVAVSVVELLLIYAIPVVCLASLWLLTSIALYVLVRSGLEFDFKQDVMRRFDAKQVLPSGTRYRLSPYYFAKILLGDSCVQAVLLYRVARFLATHQMRPLAEGVNSFSRFVTHTDISPLASIAPGLYLYHGLGTVIGKGANVGKCALICHGVTIGGGAVLGDDVKVWAGAQVLAKVSIGPRSEVGANAVVTTDFPADSVLVGVPARLARRRDGNPVERVDVPSRELGSPESTPDSRL